MKDKIFKKFKTGHQSIKILAIDDLGLKLFSLGRSRCNRILSGQVIHLLVIREGFMSKFTLKDLAYEIILELKKPLTSQEIWVYAQQKGYDKKYNFIGKDPWNTISRKIKKDIIENDKSRFVIIETRPVKFYLKELGSEKDISIIVQQEKGKIEEEPEIKFREEDLYPLLAYFCDNYNIYPKTIRHQTSSKKSYAKWLHPDVVGATFPTKSWNNEVVELSRTLGEMCVKLYSFEVKRSLGFYNLRECFFQAVSNSSWANEGYLAAVEINEDEDFQIELKRLNNAFGIGIIKLDVSNPDDSGILLPAKYKESLDWDTINKLANENPTFKDFLISVKDNACSNNFYREKFDKILEVDILKEKYSRHKLSVKTK